METQKKGEVDFASILKEQSGFNALLKHYLSLSSPKLLKSKLDLFDKVVPSLLLIL